MSNLFKKAAVFTDLHVGLKSNSVIHNEDCWNFIQWMTSKAKSEGCDVAIMTGDWHNNRASINVVSLNYSLKCLEHLNENFDQVFIIPGNHDLYYRDKRDINSVAWAKHLKNIKIIDGFLSSGDVVFAPWLVCDDHKKIPKLTGKYMFGHFELPGYLMNAMIALPEGHGEVRREHFVGFEHVFSGHFHKRQTQKNITYIGNCFPHNYADAGDDERGMMIMEWGKPPEFHSWPGQPKYRVFKLSDILNHAESMLLPGMHCRINIDIDISYEEATFVKETFIDTYKLREITLIPQKELDLGEHIIQGNIQFESVDQIVTSQLTNINSEHYNRNLLLDIYRNL
jgi:DNA repair exonuclease SbcCD nuclease subunit